MSDHPLTGDGLRQAALAAEALLRIDSARAYGLIEGGPEVVVERCEAVIAEAREAGLTWSDDEIDGAIVGLVVSGARDAERVSDFDRELIDEETRPTPRADSTSGEGWRD